MHSESKYVINTNHNVPAAIYAISVCMGRRFCPALKEFWNLKKGNRKEKKNFKGESRKEMMNFEGERNSKYNNNKDTGSLLSKKNNLVIK